MWDHRPPGRFAPHDEICDILRAAIKSRISSDMLSLRIWYSVIIHITYSLLHTCNFFQMLMRINRSNWGHLQKGALCPMLLYPVRWTAQSALHFCTPWQTCSFRHQLGFSGKHSSDAALRAKTNSLTCPPLSIARYSFIQLSQLGHQWRERKCPIFETVAKGGFENQGWKFWLSLRVTGGKAPYAAGAKRPTLPGQSSYAGGANRPTLPGQSAWPGHVIFSTLVPGSSSFQLGNLYLSWPKLLNTF